MSRATLFALPSATDRNDDQGRRSLNHLEAGARATIEQRASGPFTDPEWTAARARLLDFVGILRAWERTAADVLKR
jgi:hypothetical protein